MKIKEITPLKIIFEDNSYITYYFLHDCSEFNYADFSQIDELALETEFEELIIIETIDGYGFRFGNLPLKMFSVPCYSAQNGYYSIELYIEYVNNDKEFKQFKLDAKLDENEETPELISKYYDIINRGY